MTHFSRFQARLSLLGASLRRHSLLRPADQISFLPAFSKRATDLSLPRHQAGKIRGHRSFRPCLGPTLIATGPLPN